MDDPSDRLPIWDGLDRYVYDALLHSCNTYNEIPIIAKSVYDFKRKYNRSYTPKEALDLALYLLREETEQHFDMTGLYDSALRVLCKMIEKGERL